MPASIVVLMLMSKTLTRAGVCTCVRAYVCVQLSHHCIHSYDANVDHTMYVLKMIDEAKQPLGMIRYGLNSLCMDIFYHWLFSWFAVHCTSMNNTNELISADNKGYASYLMEHSINKALPGQVISQVFCYYRAAVRLVTLFVG